MEDLTIQVSPRSERGKQNKNIRKKKWIPAVVYGNGQKNISFSLDIRSAEKYSKKQFENKILTFESEDKNLKGLKVIKKSTDRHKVSHQPIHMDFLSLDMSKAIRVNVDIRFKGTPIAVKKEGAVFNISLRRVEIECLPKEIPPFIEVDVSQLVLNQSLHVSDLNISDNMKLITKAKRAICALLAAEKEEKQTEKIEDPAITTATAETPEKAKDSKPPGKK